MKYDLQLFGTRYGLMAGFCERGGFYVLPSPITATLLDAINTHRELSGNTTHHRDTLKLSLPLIN
jgi:hypothetical protein